MIYFGKPVLACPDRALAPAIAAAGLVPAVSAGRETRKKPPQR
jgi:hypothetical protein